MDVLHKLAVKLQRSKLLQLIFSAFILFLVYAAYKYQQSNSFSSMSELYRKNDNEKKTLTPDDNLLSVSNSGHDAPGDDTNLELPVLDSAVPIDVMITFTKAEHNSALQTKFRTCVSSLFHFATVPVNLHILGDERSRQIASEILDQSVDKSKYSLRHLDVDSLAKKAHDVVSDMQEYFSYKPGAYYSDALFFLSIVIHRVLFHLKKVIVLDADLKFNADIKHLFEEFDKFSETNIIGIARENQPVYRHALHMYRNENKGTRVGDPPPNGLTGFNSGVLLLDVEKMAHSKLYNSLIVSESVKRLTQKYKFKGHLGDQDFFSLISLENEELFHILPCSWNRQLCVWWRDNGYKNVFYQYYKCDGHINIYHGNCNTDIPKLEWENS